VTTSVDGIEECAEGAEVVIKRDGSEVARATTDVFGEFKIDKLDPGSGQYELEVRSVSASVSTKFDLGDDSLYLGVLTLAA
ncbi:MAG: oxidoreductase, partial [Gammaproteobacteria bacterium]|nr:oxidoreductase [Gammaproteobacteria bacterium]